MKPFPHYYQSHPMDCGPICLKMIAEYYGVYFNPQYMDSFSSITIEGMSMLTLADEVLKLGFTPTSMKVDIENLGKIELPVILHWNRCHFVVLYQIKNGSYYIADPATGIFSLRKMAFLERWQFLQSSDCREGIVMTLTSHATDQ